jgi:hypothetical protein
LNEILANSTIKRMLNGIILSQIIPPCMLVCPLGL